MAQEAESPGERLTIFHDVGEGRRVGGLFCLSDRKLRSSDLGQNYLFSEIGQYIGTILAMQNNIPISDSKFGIVSDPSRRMRLPVDERRPAGD